MPDGDVVYHRPTSRGYIQGYKELCEGYFSDEHVAGTIATALRKGLKNYGNHPIILINDVFTDISVSIANGIEIHSTEESYLIDKKARILMGHRRATSLAVDTCKEYVMQVTEATKSSFTIISVLRGYVSRVIQADFYESLPLVKHHMDVSSNFVSNRLQQVHPHLELEIEQIVAQIARTGKVDSLHKLARTKIATNFAEVDISSKVDE